MPDLHVKLSGYWTDYLEQVGQAYKATLAPTPDRTSVTQVAVYLRVSTEEQAEEGYSLDEQLRECRAFVERHGWEVFRVYSDDGHSGTTGERPAFQKLLQDAAAGRFQGVVIHKLDRAYRNLQGMLRVFSDWQRHGVFLASVREAIDFTTVWGKLILVVLSMLAEIFVDNLREETKKGLRGRFEKGLHNGYIPFGYCSGRCSQCADPNGPGYCPRVGLPDIHYERHAVPHPVDSRAFQHAHRLYCTGRYADRDIAAALNQFRVGSVQVRSKGKPGERPGPFTKDFVREMLQNPFYAGVVPYYSSQYDGERVIKNSRPQNLTLGRHLALITEAEFEQARQVRRTRGKAPRGTGRVAANQRGKNAPRQASRVYVLQGLLDCWRCGAPLASQSGGASVRRHVCTSRLQQTGACDQPSVKAEILEAELAQQMRQIGLTKDQQEAVMAYMLTAGGLDYLGAQRKALWEHFDHVQRLYDRGELGRQVYLQERRYYERELAALALDGESNLDMGRVRALLSDFGTLWQLLTPLEQKGICQTLLRVAEVDSGHVVAWHWYPSCITLFAC